MRLPFSKDPLAQAGAITLLLLLAVGILGAATGLFGSPSRLGGTALHPPSLNMPFGTDNLGDLFSPAPWPASNNRSCCRPSQFLSPSSRARRSACAPATSAGTRR